MAGISVGLGVRVQVKVRKLSQEDSVAAVFGAVVGNIAGKTKKQGRYYMTLQNPPQADLVLFHTHGPPNIDSKIP